MDTLTVALSKLIQIASALGLNGNDLNNANDYLIHKEYGLCFDTIVTQIYEYDIEINNDVYEIIYNVARRMNLEPDTYSFLKELIRDKNNIPKPVKEQLAKILASVV